MSDQRFDIGKEVFICVIHDSEVYTGFHQEATFASCKKFLDEVLIGKKKTFKIWFGKGLVLKTLQNYQGDGKDYGILITKVYLKDKNFEHGKCGTFAELWLELGEYARKQFSDDNPSRRKFIEAFE